MDGFVIWDLPAAGGTLGMVELRVLPLVHRDDVAGIDAPSVPADVMEPLVVGERPADHEVAEHVRKDETPTLGQPQSTIAPLVDVTGPAPAIIRFADLNVQPKSFS